MARARNIKPGFFINDQLADVEPLGRLLFAGLWTIADREGRLDDRPRRIKAEILPYDDCDIDCLLDQLATHRFIQRYEVDGNQHIQIINFAKHQNPHPRETESEIPPAPEPITDQATPRHCPGKTKDMTSPADSPIPYPSSPISCTESSNVFADDSREFYLAEKLKAFILQNNPNARTPTNLQKWAADFDKMLRIDSRSLEDIDSVMEFSQTDSFWLSNILSAGKLREQFDKLYLQSKRRPRGDPPAHKRQFTHQHPVTDLQQVIKRKTMLGLDGGGGRDP